MDCTSLVLHSLNAGIEQSDDVENTTELKARHRQKRAERQKAGNTPPQNSSLPHRKVVERDPVWLVERHHNSSCVCIRGHRFISECMWQTTDNKPELSFAHSMWFSGIALAELISVLSMRSELLGPCGPCSSLELGCGRVALPSRMLAACYPNMETIQMSDRDESCLEKARYCFRHDREHVSDIPALADEYITCKWSAQLPLAMRRHFDLILGADLVYNPECHEDLVLALSELLAQNFTVSAVHETTSPMASGPRLARSPLAILVHEDRSGTHQRFMDLLQQPRCGLEAAGRGDTLHVFETDAPPGIELVAAKRRDAMAALRMRFVFVSRSQALITTIKDATSLASSWPSHIAQAGA